MSILEHFTETFNSDNRFCFHPIIVNNIIVGGTCTHTFILPFKYSDYVESGRVLYKQGITTVLEKNIIEEPEVCSFFENNNHTTILWIKLTPDETIRFDRPLLTTEVQLEFITKTGDKIYLPVEKIRAFKPIEDIVLK